MSYLTVPVWYWIEHEGPPSQFVGVATYSTLVNIELGVGDWGRVSLTPEVARTFAAKLVEAAESIEAAMRQ